MLKLLMTTAFTLPLLFATSAHAQRGDRATNLAQDINSSLNSVQFLAQDKAQQARRNGNHNRAQNMRGIAQDARNASAKFTQTVLRPLRYGQNARFVSRNLDNLRPDFRRLFQGINQLRSGGPAFSNHIYRIQDDVRQLENVLSRGPGPGPGPVRGWTGQCTVVLETLWGTNIQEFYGRARGRNQFDAVNGAQQQAMNQCQVNLRGLTKCTVDRSNCRAFRG